MVTIIKTQDGHVMLQTCISILNLQFNLIDLFLQCIEFISFRNMLIDKGVHPWERILVPLPF